MTYTIEGNHITEHKQIFDRQGLSYHLEILQSYDQNNRLFSLIINLYRDYRNCQVGYTYCMLNPSKDASLKDIEIFAHIPFHTISDQLYRLLNWFEPTNYQKRGLGTILLKEVINFAKACQVEKLHGSLTEQDISQNPSLIKWFKKYGFQLEQPTSDEVKSAKYRACLSL